MNRRGGHTEAVQAVAGDVRVASGPDLSRDLEGYVWFDRDSEGPFDLVFVESCVAVNPERYGHEYHVTGRVDLSYAVLLPERYTQHLEAYQQRRNSST